MRRALFLIPLLLSSAACSSATEIEEATGVEETQARPAAEPVAFANNEERDGGSREFDYSWPADVSAIPALVQQLTTERDRILAQEKVEWTDALADMPLDCASCRSRSFAKEWKVVTDTPSYLSLSAIVSTYTGGAHGMYGLESLVWDKAKNAAMPAIALFRSPAALDQALGPRLCAALNAEREKRRGEPILPVAEDDTGFSACQLVKDATVLVGSATGKAFDRITVWFGPYVAGPYAEGAYQLDFPVDAAVLKAVKPEYAGAFGAR